MQETKKITRAQYEALRERRTQEEPQHRQLCFKCRQPQLSCACAKIIRVDSKIKFVILIHSIEAKRRIATGRLAHLCLENSELITGHDYSTNQRVNELISDPVMQPFLLYPGAQAVNFSEIQQTERLSLFDKALQPVIFVVDGTWNTAKKMVRLSQNLESLPRLCFTPPQRSRFLVRKQPSDECFSTIEAIHHTIDALAPARGFDVSTRAHDNLMQVFEQLVAQQLEYVKKSAVRFVRHKSA